MAMPMTCTGVPGLVKPNRPLPRRSASVNPGLDSHRLRRGFVNIWSGSRRSAGVPAGTTRSSSIFGLPAAVGANFVMALDSSRESRWMFCVALRCRQRLGHVGRRCRPGLCGFGNLEGHLRAGRIGAVLNQSPNRLPRAALGASATPPATHRVTAPGGAEP